jgi:hypothetical protein
LDLKINTTLGANKMADVIKSESEQKKEDWMNSKWRPMMGWMYMLVCTMDMVVFPILWSLLQTFTHTQITQWNPLTLQGAGLFHIAMGAVLGIAAFGRTQEKLGGANNGGLQTPTAGPSGGFTAPSAPATGGFGPTGGFGSPATSVPGGFNGSAGFGAGTTTAPTVATGFGGKPAPMQPEQPPI